jgi:hypothetical protein
MFPPGERSVCPVCGVALVAFTKLAPSVESTTDDDIPPEPEWEPLPVTYLGRGRGALAALALLGLVAFCCPWVDMTMPDVVRYSGLDIARRLGWAWAAGVAWFVLLPIALSRRSIMQMRGARVAACFLSAIPGTTATLLLTRPPHGAHGVPVRFAFAWGLHSTLLVSIFAVVVAIFFGGRADDIRLRRGSSGGEVVH